MNAIAVPLRRRAAPPPMPPELVEGRLLPSLATRSRQNWVFYAFVMLIPLQNIYSGYVPNIGGGINFLNVMFAGSLLMALHCGGGLVRGYGVNGWAFAFMAVAGVALMVGLGTVADTDDHVSSLKDQLIGMSFLFLAQMSANDWGTVRRLLIASFVPLPYMAYVVRDQHRSVASWHYNHDLRVAGTFPELGSNEFAAFCVTAMLMATGLLVAVRLRWGWRGLLMAAAGLAGIGIALTYSRTAYIAVLLGLGMMLLLRRQHRLQMMLVALLALAVVPAFLPHSVIQRFESIELDEETRDESTDSRFVFWGIAWERFTERPILGTGYHTFSHPEVNPLEMDTHNFFLRELTEKGVVGAVVLIGLLASIFLLLWRGYRSTRHGVWVHGLFLALLCAYVALLAGNMFGDRFSHYPMAAHFWLYVGLALRSAALLREQRLREKTHARK